MIAPEMRPHSPEKVGPPPYQMTLTNCVYHTCGTQVHMTTPNPKENFRPNYIKILVSPMVEPKLIQILLMSYYMNGVNSSKKRSYTSALMTFYAWDLMAKKYSSLMSTRRSPKIFSS